jgi:hypothetical protein
MHAISKPFFAISRRGFLDQGELQLSRMPKAQNPKGPRSLRDRTGAPWHIGTVGIFGHPDAPEAASRGLAKAQELLRQYWPDAELQRLTPEALEGIAKEYLAKRELYEVDQPPEQKRQINEIRDRAEALLKAINGASKIAGDRLARRVKQRMGMELRKYGSKDHDAQGLQELLIRFRKECEQTASEIAALGPQGRLPIEHVRYLTFALVEQWCLATGLKFNKNLERTSKKELVHTHVIFVIQVAQAFDNRITVSQVKTSLGGLPASNDAPVRPNSTR